MILTKISETTSAEEFTYIVENVRWEFDMTYLEAILRITDDNDKEVEDIIPFIDNVLKGKMENEAMNNNRLTYKNDECPIFD